MEQVRQCRRMLPIVEFDGRSWFLDKRLKEFRDVKNPHNRVDFRSKRGDRMLDAWIGQLSPSELAAEWEF